MPVEAHLQFLDCPTCARGALFEQPPCIDGHGADCAEWFCVDCGTAVLLGAAVSGSTLQSPPLQSPPLQRATLSEATEPAAAGRHAAGRHAA